MKGRDAWVMTSSLLMRNKTQPGNPINHKLFTLGFHHFAFVCEYSTAVLVFVSLF